MAGELLGILHSVTSEINLLLLMSLFFTPMTTVNSLKGRKSQGQKARQKNLRESAPKGWEAL